jgi:hypothetical protein
MLHISDKQMPWSVQESGTLGWVNDKQFLSELGTQVELEEARIRATVHTFYEERLLSKIQEETTRSRLSIIVFDDRRPTQPPTPPLPQLPISDSRTTYRINTQR